MCQNWSEARWDSLAYGRHLKGTRRKWGRNLVQDRTTWPNEPSQYNPNFSIERIKTLEMECASGDPELGNFIQGNCRTKTFYRCVEEFDEFGGMIGVSRGEFTRYIFVTRQSDGSVHGYPITWDELVKNKGVKGDET